MGSDLLFAASILWMYHVAAHVPGGQPIGALEKFAAQSGKAIRKLFRLGRRRSRLLAQDEEAVA